MLETIAIRTVWGKALDALKRVPWWVWAALAVLAFWWIDRGAQYRAGYREASAAAEARYTAALAEATKAAEDAKQSEEAALVALAERTDENVEKKLDSEFDRARDYVARNRVRTEGNRSAACPASTPARDQGTGNDAGAGGAPVMDDTDQPDRVDDDAGLVSVPARDVMICTRNTVLAEQWREWGLALEARGRE